MVVAKVLVVGHTGGCVRGLGGGLEGVAQMSMGLLAVLALPCAAAPAAVAPPVVLVTLDPNFTRGVPLLGFGNELAWQRANDSALA